MAAQVTGCNIKQLMTMLSTALKREDERWIPCSFLTSTTQDDMTCASDRSEMVEWFSALNHQFDFDPETMFTSVAILDRFLTSVKVKRKYLRCVAVTCFYLATKTTEDEDWIPSTRDLVRSTLCGCSISEVHRMELCILDNFSWDLRTSTPLEFLHLYHSFLVSMRPDLLNGFPPMSPSQHLHQVTQVLEECLLHHQLMGFPPSAMALAVLSLDLEAFCPYWSNATLALQKLAQIDQQDLLSCRKLILRCLNRKLDSPCSDRHPALSEWAPTKRRVDLDSDNIYDGIRCLYGEEAADVTSAVVRMTCGSEAARTLTSEQPRKITFTS